MTTPLRNILTTRGVLAGLRDAIYRQMSSSVDDQSLTLLNHPNVHLVENWILNSSLLLLATSTFLMQKDTLRFFQNNDKIRPWKQFSRTEMIVKFLAIVLICIFSKNVERVG